MSCRAPSTLTMQTVRLLEPRQRTVWSKLLKWRARFNLGRRITRSSRFRHVPDLGAPWRQSRGRELRAWHFRQGAVLSEAEAALLVALPQSPESQRPRSVCRRRPGRAQQNFGRLRDAGDDSRLRGGPAEPMPSGRFPAPNDAPHLALRLRLDNAGDQTIETTIDHALRRVQDPGAPPGIAGAR